MAHNLRRANISLLRAATHRLAAAELGSFGNGRRVVGLVTAFLLAIAIDARAIETAQGKLQLSLSFPDGVSSGSHALRVVLTLENVSSSLVKACLSKSWGVELFGKDGKASGVEHMIDHPTCVQALDLRPGDSFTSPREIEVSNVTPGLNTATGQVEFIIPGTCGKWGCKAYSVKSAPLTVNIEAK